MPLVSTRDLIEAASQAGEAIAAFNVITLEHAEAIAAGAEQAGRPAILQISHNAVRYHGGALEPIARATAAVAEASDARLSLHLDHVEDLDLFRRAAGAGFSSAMFDAGALPYAANVRATRDATELGHAQGLWIEAELGYVGGKPDAPASAHAPGVRTDPDEAGRFVADTGVDGLAVAVGSSHAMTSRSASLDSQLIAALHAALSVPLVLHGSSGVPDDELRAAVRSGITKVNIGTALNVAATSAVRAALEASTSSDPRKYLAPARTGMTEVVVELLQVLASTKSSPLDGRSPSVRPA